MQAAYNWLIPGLIVGIYEICLCPFPLPWVVFSPSTFAIGLVLLIKPEYSDHIPQYITIWLYLVMVHVSLCIFVLHSMAQTWYEVGECTDDIYCNIKIALFGFRVKQSAMSVEGTVSPGDLVEIVGYSRGYYLVKRVFQGID